MEHRAFELDTVTVDSDEEGLGDAWREVVGDRKFVQGHFVYFGFAEEVIGLLEFTDGTFEVGVGESLRPYIKLYTGNRFSDAWSAFAIHVLSRAVL